MNALAYEILPSRKYILETIRLLQEIVLFQQGYNWLLLELCQYLDCLIERPLISAMMKLLVTTLFILSVQSCTSSDRLLLNRADIWTLSLIIFHTMPPLALHKFPLIWCLYMLSPNHTDWSLATCSSFPTTRSYTFNIKLYTGEACQHFTSLSLAYCSSVSHNSGHIWSFAHRLIRFQA